MLPAKTIKSESSVSNFVISTDPDHFCSKTSIMTDSAFDFNRFQFLFSLRSKDKG